jgi:hypothetical protein
MHMGTPRSRDRCGEQLPPSRPTSRRERGRSTSAQFANFLQQALGSARELDYHLLLARDLELLSTTDHATLEARTDQVTRMLVALRRTVHDRALTHPPRKARKTGKSPGPQA